MQRFISTLPNYLLPALGASLVLPLALTNLVLIACCVSCLLNFSWPVFKKNVLRNKTAMMTVAIFAFIFISGWLNSSNTHEALKYTERKLAFLVLPICMGCTSWSNQTFKNTLRAFVYAILVAGIYAIGAAFHTYQTTNSSEAFFYHELAGHIHFNAIYFSFYCLLAIIFIIEIKLFGKAKMTMIALLALLLLLLSSKMVLVLFIFYLIRLAWLHLPFVKQKKISILILGASILAGVLWLTPFIRGRISTELHSNLEVIKQDHYVYNTPFTGFTLRCVLWKHSWHILQQKKLLITGVGSGDFQQLLNETYTRTGMYMGNPELHDKGYHGYNPHNQYVEIALAFGFLGLFYWLLWIIILWTEADKCNVLGLKSLLSTMIVLSLSECIMSANKGIVPLVFLITLLINQKRQSINQNTEIIN